MTNEQIHAALVDAKMIRDVLISRIDNLVGDTERNNDLCDLLDEQNERIERLESTLAVRETAQMMRAE